MEENFLNLMKGIYREHTATLHQMGKRKTSPLTGMPGLVTSVQRYAVMLHPTACQSAMGPI